MNTRGTYGNWSCGASRRSYGHRSLDNAPWGYASVGLKLFHTPGDSDRATAQIDTEMNAIVDSVYLAMGVDPSVIRRKFTIEETVKMPKEDLNAWKDHVLAAKAKAVQSPFWGFWTTVVSPIYDEWMHFRGDQKYYNLFTSWEEYEKWLERAKQLRATVEAKGIRVETPNPADLTKTLPGAALEAGGRAAEKAGEAIWEFGKIAKWAAIGALVIGGVVALSSVAHNLRSGQDPAERYITYAGRGTL